MSALPAVRRQNATEVFELSITPEEYLKSELLSEVRREYVEGYVFEMAGASDNHGRIVHNVSGMLYQRLRGTGCEAFSENMKLKLKASLSGIYYYPDVLVVCDPTDNARYFRERPIVVFEVLSPDDPPDAGPLHKLLAYLNLAPSLQSYVIIFQDKVTVRTYRRAEPDWETEELTSVEDTLRLAAIGCELPLTELYERVSWRAEAK